MNTHTEREQKNRSQSEANVISQKQGVSESTFQFADDRPEAISQRKLQEMANNSPQAKQAAQLQAMADHNSAQHQGIANNEQKLVAQTFHPVTQLASRKDLMTLAPAIQLMKDKGDKLAAQVAEKWSIDISEAKPFVAWCENAQEVQDWIDYNSHDDWKDLQALKPGEHNADAIAKILEAARKTKKQPAKAKAAEPTDEELQIAIALAQEEQREKNKKTQKDARQIELTSFNLVSGAAVAADPVLSVVWPTILSEYVNRINPNLSVSQKFSSEQLTTALAVWRQQTQTLRGNKNVSYVSTFSEVQDKSQRADGGSNSNNLVQRKNQADFIIEINGYRINAHVDQS